MLAIFLTYIAAPKGPVGIKRLSGLSRDSFEQCDMSFLLLTLLHYFVVARSGLKGSTATEYEREFAFSTGASDLNKPKQYSSPTSSGQKLYLQQSMKHEELVP